MPLPSDKSQSTDYMPEKSFRKQTAHLAYQQETAASNQFQKAPEQTFGPQRKRQETPLFHNEGGEFYVKASFRP